MKQLKKSICTLLMLLTLSCSSAVVLSCVTTPITAEAATIKINKNILTLNKGKTFQLKVTGTQKKVTWKSSKSSVAKVNSKGKVTAKKEGTAKITATVNGKKYTCKVTVENPTINKKELTLYVGDTYNLKLNNTTQKPLWSSSDNTVATVDANGIVTACNPGTALIDALIRGKGYRCTVTVKEEPSQIEPEPPKKSGKTILKEYMSKYGRINSDGNRFITTTLTAGSTKCDYSIVYEWSKDNFNFIQIYEDGSDESALNMNIPNRDTTFTTANVYQVFGLSAAFSTTAMINIATYNKNSVINFEITKITGISASAADSVIELSNDLLKLAVSGWDILLKKEVGITIQDIGFLSYN